MPATWSGTDAAVNEAAGFGISVTFSGRSIGTASSTRIVVVLAGIDNQAAGAVTLSATIGGVSATSAVSTGSIASGAAGAALFYANVPTGTTADIVITASVAGIQYAGIAVGKLDGVNSTPSSTAVGDYQVTQNSPYPTTSNITVNSGGFGIAGAWQDNSTTAIGWGNITLDRGAQGAAHVAVANGFTSSAGAIAPSATGGNFSRFSTLAAAWDAAAAGGGNLFRQSDLAGLGAGGPFFGNPLARQIVGWMPGLVTARRKLITPPHRRHIERRAA